MELSPHSALASLVQRAQRGDRQAFTELYRRTAQVQYFTIIGKIGQEHADDLLQEVYLTLWQNISKVRPYAVVAYLNSVTHNLCFKYLRDSQIANARVALPDEDMESLKRRPAADTDDPAHLANQRDTSDRLRHALRTYLNDEERELLLMRYYQRLKLTEIAEETGLSLSTVKRSIKQALKTLREKMGVVFLPWGFTNALTKAIDHPQAPETYHNLVKEEQVLQRVSHTVAAAVIAIAAAAVLSTALTPEPEELLLEESPPLVATEQPIDSTPPKVISQTLDEGLVKIVAADNLSGIASIWCTGANGATHLPLDENEILKNTSGAAGTTSTTGEIVPIGAANTTARKEEQNSLTLKDATVESSEETARPEDASYDNSNTDLAYPEVNTSDISNAQEPLVRTCYFILETGTYELHITDTEGNHAVYPLEVRLYPEP